MQFINFVVLSFFLLAFHEIGICGDSYEQSANSTVAMGKKRDLGFSLSQLTVDDSEDGAHGGFAAAGELTAMLSPKIATVLVLGSSGHEFRALGRLLRSLNFEVETAESVEEAVGIISHSPQPKQLMANLESLRFTDLKVLADAGKARNKPVIFRGKGGWQPDDLSEASVDSSFGYLSHSASPQEVIEEIKKLENIYQPASLGFRSLT